MFIIKKFIVKKISFKFRSVNFTELYEMYKNIELTWIPLENKFYAFMYIGTLVTYSAI